MCGRVIQRTPAATMAHGFGAALNGGDLFPPGEYEGGDNTLAIITGDEGPEATVIRWGLEVEWLPAGELLRHARAETVLRKRTFQESAQVRRGIMPVDAWIERGTRRRGPRGPHMVWPKARTGAGLATLWWRDRTSDRPARLVIVTKQAMGAPAHIHHRTPMLVTPDDVKGWLDPTSKIASIHALLARPAAAEGELETTAGGDRTSEAPTTGRTRIVDGRIHGVGVSR